MKKLLLTIIVLASFSIIAQAETKTNQVTVTMDENASVNVDCGDNLTVGRYEGHPSLGIESLTISCRPIKCIIYDQKMETGFFSYQHSKEKVMFIEDREHGCYSDLESAVASAKELVGVECKSVEVRNIVSSNGCK